MKRNMYRPVLMGLSVAALLLDNARSRSARTRIHDAFRVQAAGSEDRRPAQGGWPRVC
jgi:hypothetical protein